MNATNTVIVSDKCPAPGKPSFDTVAIDTASLTAIKTLLAQVKDPEIPVLSIADLGVLRDVLWRDGQLVVVITPTYAGCPAMTTFADDIEALLRQHGIANVVIETQLSPAWTTDWLTEAGKEKLRAFGIAPPVGASTSKRSLLGEEPVVICPRCQSDDTKKISQHGSTACKALYQCNHCLEPFDYFKCI